MKHDAYDYISSGIVTGGLAFVTVHHYAPWWIALNVGLIVCRFMWAIIEAGQR